jgi:flagellar biosynthesis protein
LAALRSGSDLSRPSDHGAEDDTRAVALEYDRANDPAPRVVAKGQGPIAEQIIALAREHDIAIRKDADLVGLLSQVELDSPIPIEAFAAVAEILSYIYRANGTLRDARTGKSPERRGD